MSASRSEASRWGTSRHPAWINVLNFADSVDSGSKKPFTTALIPWSGVNVTIIIPWVVMVR